MFEEDSDQLQVSDASGVIRVTLFSHEQVFPVLRGRNSEFGRT